jgi:hypothetical protein
MMEVFAEDNEGLYPRAGGPGSTWTYHGVLQRWDGGRGGMDEAFGIIRDPEGNITTPGEATITSSFYLLVKYYGVQPKQFVCKSDTGASEFKFKEYRTRARTLEEVFDFGDGQGFSGYLPMPGEVVSYAYHMPYSSYPGGPSLTIRDTSSPRSPVCADRNPFLDKNTYDLYSSPEIDDNSASHQGKGQNVLYRDGSVQFETSPNVGIGGDNIYTYGDDPNGTPPYGNGDGIPFSPTDAYLVGEQNFR